MYFTAEAACSSSTVNRRKPANEGSSAVAAASSGGEANELNDEVAVEHNEPKKKVTAGEGVKVASPPSAGARQSAPFCPNQRAGSRDTRTFGASSLALGSAVVTRTTTRSRTRVVIKI